MDAVVYYEENIYTPKIKWFEDNIKNKGKTLCLNYNQYKILRKDIKNSIIRLPRRAGQSTCIILDATYDAITKPSSCILVFCLNELAKKGLYYEACEIINGSFENATINNRAAEERNEIYFINGSKIIFCNIVQASKIAFLRGKIESVYVDGISSTSIDEVLNIYKGSEKMAIFLQEQNNTSEKQKKEEYTFF